MTHTLTIPWFHRSKYMGLRHNYRSLAPRDLRICNN